MYEHHSSKKEAILAFTLAALLIGSVVVGSFTMARFVYAQESGDPAASEGGETVDSSSSADDTNSTSSTPEESGSSDNSEAPDSSNSTSTPDSSAGDSSSETDSSESTTSTTNDNSAETTEQVNATAASESSSNATATSDQSDSSSEDSVTTVQLTPEITSDKQEYSPGETAHIQGINFEPNTSYDLYVFRGDGWLIRSDGSDGFDTIIADASGSFDYSYVIPSVNGEWMILIYESEDIELINLLGRIGFEVDAPTLSTDKFDYDPSDVVTVSGKGFSAGESYDIVIERPDGSIIKGDGAFTEGFDSLNADLQGKFTYSYILNGIPGAYQIYAYHSSDESHAELIARGGFADANTGPLYGGTATSSTWSGASNAQGPADDICATSSGNNQFIDVTNFGFTTGMIPAGATITGIIVEVDLLGSTGGGDRKVDVQLLKGGSPVGSFVNDFEPTKALCNAAPIEDFVTLSAPTNATWGAEFSQADVISSGFGVRVKQDSGSGMRFLDSVRITITFTESNTGKISGLKFNDLNGNGVQDGGEPVLPGWTINLVNPTTNAIISSTVTNASGLYQFSSLAAGSYVINETLQAGWIQTAPASTNYTIVVASTTNSQNNDFGNFELGEISGVKFEDTNANGIKDNTEDILLGWNITLTGPIDGSVLTDGNGAYKFSDLTNGTYTVSEIVQTGWIQTTSPISYIIDITSGTNSTDNNFGNFELGEISGIKYEDINDNGVQDSGEPALQGWNITLTGPISSSMLTDADGLYKFTGLTNGTYTVSEMVEPGWIQTSFPMSYVIDITSGVNSTNNDFGNFELGEISGIKFDDVNANGLRDGGEPTIEGWNITLSGPINSWVLTGSDGTYSFDNLINGTYIVSEEIPAGWIQTAGPISYELDITSGTNSTDNDFGNFRLGEISGTKYEDVNANGIQDGGEPGLQDWNITLSGPVSGSMLTDADGLYKFTGLTNGTYTVSEMLEAGWIQTSTPTSYLVDITSGTNVTNLDFGNFELGEISGMKFEDINGNGIMDGADQPLSDWNITLTGPINASMLTDSDGNYKFTGLTNGTYTVAEELQTGWIQTSSPTSYVIDITSGTNSTDNDFGNFELGEISGMKYEDINGNGIQDGGEPTLQDWNITLTGPINTWMLTDIDGKYSFTGLTNGSYAVSEMVEDGWAQTSTPTSYPIDVTSGTNSTDNDFGNFRLVTISGMKFEDHDGDGTQDGGDQGIDDWTIELYNVTSDLLIGSTTTSGGGLYEFDDLPPGEYAVREVLQAGWIQTTVNPANITASSGVNSTGNDFGNFELGEISGVKYDDTNGNGVQDGGEPTLSGWNITLSGPINTSMLTDADGEYKFTDLINGTYTVAEELQTGWIQTSTPTSYVIDITSGVNSTDNDFGNFRLVSISGMKFNDTNGSNSKDSGEAGLPNWNITLYNATTNILIASTLTNGTGHYAFEGLGPGEYAIREVIQVGWIQTTPNPANITAMSGQNVTDVDFGNFRLPVSQVTSSSLAVTGFDMDPSEPDQDFRLILTHDPKNPAAYRLTASNPGQFYYNVFYSGTPGDDFEITMEIPYPFVTQGSQPIQLHNGVSILGGAYMPGPTVPADISGFKPGGSSITTTTPSGALAIALGDYEASPVLGETQVTIVISGEVPDSGLAYVTIHLDYGLKGTGNYGKDGSNNAVVYGTSTIVIGHHENHNFDATTPSDTSSPIVYNINVFKHDPGFVGVVTNTSSGETIQGAKIQVYTSAGKLVGTTYTDENGYYQYYYKYTGKSTTFIVKLVDYSQQQSVTLKANGFAVAYFQIP